MWKKWSTVNTFWVHCMCGKLFCQLANPLPTSSMHYLFPFTEHNDFKKILKYVFMVSHCANEA